MGDDFDGLVRKRKNPEDGWVERLIVKGLIVSDKFTQEAKPVIDAGRFEADFAGKVASWCLEYWNNYGCSPGKNIEQIYLVHRKELDEGQASLIEAFLTDISDEYERSEAFNVPYILDLTENHFRLVGLRELRNNIDKAIKGGKPEQGEAMVKEYKRPARMSARGVDPLRDVNFILEANKPQEENPDVLFSFPGALGEACGQLERGFLIAFQAESGVGKTWWLWFIARLAVMAGFNVVFFSLEMKEKKMGRRMWQDLTGSPTKGEGRVLIPVFDCLKNQADICTMKERTCQVGLYDEDGNLPIPGTERTDYSPCSACRQNWDDSMMTTWWKVEQRDILDSAVAIKKHAVMERTGSLKKMGKLHLVEFPMDSLTIEEMTAYVNNLEYYDDFIVDVGISDYADKYKWSNPQDAKNSIDKIWAGHKGLAQEKSCLWATASQSNTERSGKKVGKASWADSIEKRRGIDLGIALNQKPEDSQNGLMYLSIDKMRHEETVFTEVAVLQQLAIGRPYIDSCFVRRTFKK